MYGIYAVLQTISSKTDPIVCVQGTFSPSSLHVEEGLEATSSNIFYFAINYCVQQ